MSARLMVVDDIPANVKLLEAKLTQEYYEVITANSGAEAIERAVAESPDVILLDVMMPGMDGPTTFTELRNIPGLQHVPIIFMTAKVQKHEIEDYKRLSGAAGVITKPFDPMTLLKEIQAITNDFAMPIAS